MRAIWSGSINFGLVNIPIKLFSASKSSTIELDMLHKKDYSPIRYARICREEGREVPYDEIVKGYQYQKGDYVILTNEDFQKANLRKTKSIDIEEFVEAKEIDPIYYEKPYYIAPDKGAERAYFLLKESLEKSKKVGIGRFVLRNREHLVLVRPYKNIILVEQMRFGEDVRSEKELELNQIKENPGREIEIALALINQMTKTFNIKKFKDSYNQELFAIIEEKAKGKIPKARGKAPSPTEIKDLMEVLKKSLEQERKKVK